MMRTIQCKYSEYVLVPQEAVVGLTCDEQFYTMDRKLCKAQFISGWNNGSGCYTDDLDELCMKTWNYHFHYIRSIWIERIGYVGDVWHWIRLIEQ